MSRRQAVPADKFYYSSALFDGCHSLEFSELIEDTLRTSRATYFLIEILSFRDSKVEREISARALADVAVPNFAPHDRSAG